MTRMSAPTGPAGQARPRTLADKVWDTHVVEQTAGEPDLLYIDLHLIHEATSPQAFDGLRARGRPAWRPELTLALEDHNVPTDGLVIQDPLSREQLAALRRNCAEFGVELFQLGDQRQGIVHVVGPELGLVQPGMMVACGDSHTSTHGAFGALAFGIGTSEVEHILTTQTLRLRRWQTMSVDFTGSVPPGVTAKDMMLAFIAQVGANGARGHIVEYRGEAVRQLSMEARMTMCNLTIEAGARAGLIAPDQTTFDYLRGRPYAPGPDLWARAEESWRALAPDPGAEFDATVRLDATQLSPYVTWGTKPSQAAPLSERVPDPCTLADADARAAAERALQYMDITAGTRLTDLPVDVVFLGSCTNGRLEDLRAAANVLRGRKVADGVRMLIVPGSMQVRAQADDEGLGEVFRRAGAEWRSAGCSMCIAMNPDRVGAGQRCASTSNRNFEGRQGTGARTHLVSPVVAAATAVTGRLTAPADL